MILLSMVLLTIMTLSNMYSRSKKKKKLTPIYFYTNYHTEMKLVPIVMDYCLLKFEALNIFLGVSLHGGGGVSQPNFSFFNVNPQVFQRIIKYTYEIAWI